MVERKMVQQTIFGPKPNPENTKEGLTYKETVEIFMKNVDDLKKNELYKHDKGDCSKDCLRRGCGSVAVGDGNWKLTHVIRVAKKRNIGEGSIFMLLFPAFIFFIFYSNYISLIAHRRLPQSFGIAKQLYFVRIQTWTMLKLLHQQHLKSKYKPNYPVNYPVKLIGQLSPAPLLTFPCLSGCAPHPHLF